MVEPSPYVVVPPGPTTPPPPTTPPVRYVPPRVPTTPRELRVVPPPEPDASTPQDDDLPLRWQLHGYYRARYVSTSGLPIPDFAAGADRGVNASYVYQRLRLEPALLYGEDRDKPQVALRMQVDGLDNVVFGDNARRARTPVFASDPSATDIEGFDVGDTIFLRRAWLEFQLPVGQLRVGRMGSQWGLGLLTSGGDGLESEWGDPHFGTTYDRILFATQPLTIWNVLAHGDARPTPLIFAMAYDQLVEDPLGVAADPSDPATRSAVPFSFLGEGGDDVQETVFALAWNQKDLNPERASDALSAGLYFVHRWQNVTRSDINIFDAFWKLRYSAFGPQAPAIFTQGELVTIQGTTSGLSIRPGFEDTTGRGPATDANIWGGVFKLGLADDAWMAYAEAGFASGDAQLMDDAFTQRPLHPDYHVGLVLYPIALAARTANGLGEDLRPLWSRGGVWNSSYLFPQASIDVTRQFSVRGGLLLAWADELSSVYFNDRADGSVECSLAQSDCFLGWEADVATKLVWGDDDLMRWTNEFGVFHAGAALSPLLQEDWIYTFQSRIAMVF